jgi:radical SAM superfamily enzyme YgiQ (UPF0313 family)
MLAGSRSEMAGRNIAGYRLRTAAEQFKYNMLIIDSATAMSSNELELILDATVTNDTLILGISIAWLDWFSSSDIEWINDDVLARFKSKYNHLKIIIGGSDDTLRLLGSKSLYKICDWFFQGFSDVSFPKLLDLLSNKPNHGLKYMINNQGKKIVESNAHHPIIAPDSIETVFKTEDNFKAHQPIPLEVSRGCIFSCPFCTHPFQGKKDFDSYIRTPASIASELRRNYELFGTTRYSIMDDTFNDSIEKINRLEQAVGLARIPNFEFVAYIKPELLVTKTGMMDSLIRLGLKGAFFGVESMNNNARKIVHKGMDVQKILDSASYLSSNGVKVHASFISGLPGESIADLYHTHEFLVNNKDKIFTSWIFQPLGLYLNDDMKGTSDMEKNPEKYGYTIINPKPSSIQLWKNEHMTLKEAAHTSNILTDLTRKIVRPAGWWLSSAWNNNETQERIDTMTVTELDLHTKSRQLVRTRALTVINQFK